MGHRLNNNKKNVMFFLDIFINRVGDLLANHLINIKKIKVMSRHFYWVLIRHILWIIKPEINDINNIGIGI